MRRFLSLLTAVVDNSNRGRGPSRRNPSVRPGLEALEERQVLSTLFLTPGGNDATHFSTLQAAYNAARPGDVIQVEPGAVVSDPSGTISIAKSITLQGDPAFGRAPVASNVTLAQDPHHIGDGTTVVLQHLDLGNGAVTASGLLLLTTTIEDSTLHNVTEDGAGLGKVVIGGNTITGSVSISNGELGDEVTNNTFPIIDAGTRAAIVVTGDSRGTIISGNTIEFHTQSASNEGLVIDVGGIGAPLVVANNTFDTNRAGTGLVIREAGGVKVERNDFNANAVGVDLDGDNMGAVDLGGGPLGSRGLNSFVSYGGNDGRLAIVLKIDPSCTVEARGNLWSPLIDPHSVIEDGTHHGGSGILDLGMNTVPRRSGGGAGWSPSYPLGSGRPAGMSPAARRPPRILPSSG
jgi:hypothetical protein